MYGLKGKNPEAWNTDEPEKREVVEVDKEEECTDILDVTKEIIDRGKAHDY